MKSSKIMDKERIIELMIETNPEEDEINPTIRKISKINLVIKKSL
jgi:hypothetical protein